MALLATACGSRGPLYDEPFRGRDGGSDVGLSRSSVDATSIDAASVDAASVDAAEECDWEEVSEGLTGAGIAVLEVDTRGETPVLYGASSAHLYRSTDGGRTWETRGVPPAAVRGLAFPDEPTELLVATLDGVWVSHDAALTFEQRSLRGLAVREIEAHPAGRDRVIASVESLGVLQSNDAGETWQPTSGGLDAAESVLHLLPDPRDLAVTVAGSISSRPGPASLGTEGGMLRTTTAGAVWEQVQTTGGRVFDVSRCPANPDVIYAARYYGLYRSTDGGASFAPVAALAGPEGVIPGTTPVTVSVSGAACERIVVFVATPSFGLFVSEDGGDRFEGPFLEGLGVSRLARTVPILREVPGGAVVAASTGLFLSEDLRRFDAIGGLSEVAVGPLVAAGGHLWAGSSGTGVWVLQQETLRWERIPTSSLENDYVFSLLPLGIADVASGDVLVGSYGYLYGRLDSASTFSRVPNEGVDADNVFDFAVLDDGTILSASQTEGIQRSDDRGRTFRLSRDGIVPWATAIGIATDLRSVAAGADGSGVVVAGTSGGLGSGIWRSTDRGRTWAPTEQSEGLVGPVRYLRGHDLFLASLSGAGVVTSRDGLRWTAANEGLRSLDVTGVATDGARVFITAGGAVYEGASLPDVRWQLLDERCAPPQAVAPAIVERPDGRWLFVAAGSHGARRHAID